MQCIVKTHAWAANHITILHCYCTAAILQKTFDNIKDTLNAIINFYIWVFNTFIGIVSNIANKASDVVQGGGCQQLAGSSDSLWSRRLHSVFSAEHPSTLSLDHVANYSKLPVAQQHKTFLACLC